MDFIIKGTSLFIESINKLSKKYPTIKKDVFQEFDGLTFETIFAKNYTLKDSGSSKFQKIRVANSFQNKGKSSGFRLLIFTDSKERTVFFIGIFSKTGTEGKDNIEKEDFKECVNILKAEKQTNTLTEFTLYSLCN
jgi:hypothetical protein